MTKEQLPARTELRARVYKLLSDCFQSPDAEFPERMRELPVLLDALHPDIRLEVPDMPGLTDDTDIKDMPDAAGAGSFLEQLKVEHARLFIGPFSLPVPPYGSMYLDPEQHLMSESTKDVHRWYLSEGIETAMKEMPDHICVELEFLYLLAYRELKSLEGAEQPGDAVQADLAAPATYRDKQRRFLEQHLGRWAPAFEEKVREHTGQEHPMSAPYRELAVATRRFLAADLEELRRDIPG
jgi:putative dimethyl sulfoxide reductase chaperone